MNENIIDLNNKLKNKRPDEIVSWAINQYGNPYSLIITDNNGTISIQLGAYGVPETYIINKEKKIIKKYIGPLDQQSLKEINLILK